MTTFAAVGIVTAAGLVRGTTGFGGAMLMAPVLSVLLGPIPAVVTALCLETAAALVMFPDALPKAQWRTLLYLILPAVVTVPL
ncbi:MAG: sulfite exporter TauE/SafE family protein, partial [Pseudolabrys sp.]